MTLKILKDFLEKIKEHKFDENTEIILGVYINFPKKEMPFYIGEIRGVTPAIYIGLEGEKKIVFEGEYDCKTEEIRV